MTFQSLCYSLHVLAGTLWVGGMFFAWAILRPAALEAVQGPSRLKLWEGVFRRFFAWVWLCVAILPISGMVILNDRFSGFETAPRHVQAMMGGYLVMLALYLKIQALRWPELRAAMLAEDWTAGATALAAIRRLVGANLSIGIAITVLATLRPAW